MKRVRIGIIALAALSLTTAAWAQKPDFSGTWTLDPEQSTMGGGRQGGRMGGMMGMGAMTVKQTADTLTIENEGRGGMTMTRTYKLDGSESEIQMGRMAAKATAKWDGDKIVITTTREGRDGSPVTTTETWSLSNGMLTIESTGGRGGGKRVYKK